MVTVLPYGLLPRAELATLRNPSMAGALEVVVGRWGNMFISVGLLISVLGAFPGLDPVCGRSALHGRQKQPDAELSITGMRPKVPAVPCG
jgi:hypothetical protein